MHNPVGPFAVAKNGGQIFIEVTTNLQYQLALVLSQFLIGFGDDLLQLVQNLNGPFREVLDEIKWILDFVGNARRQLTQGRQFFRA